jgi:hypothetical protein
MAEMGSVGGEDATTPFMQTIHGSCDLGLGLGLVSPSPSSSTSLESIGLVDADRARLEPIYTTTDEAVDRRSVCIVCRGSNGLLLTPCCKQRGFQCRPGSLIDRLHTACHEDSCHDPPWFHIGCIPHYTWGHWWYLATPFSDEWTDLSCPKCAVSIADLMPGAIKGMLIGISVMVWAGYLLMLVGCIMLLNRFTFHDMLLTTLFMVAVGTGTAGLVFYLHWLYTFSMWMIDEGAVGFAKKINTAGGSVVVDGRAVPVLAVDDIMLASLVNVRPRMFPFVVWALQVCLFTVCTVLLTALADKGRSGQ